MTWEEHEKEYCLEIKPRVDDIFDVFDTYCDSVNYADKEEQHEDYYNK